MTASLNTPVDQVFDWRSQSVCEPDGTDRAYDTVEDLMDEGLPEDEAVVAVQEAEAEAKRVCLSCPVRTKCLGSAMANKEEHGVWGGYTVAEREAYRPTYLKIKKLQGLSVPAPVQKDHDLLHSNQGVNSKYLQREQRALAAKDKLMLSPGYVLDLGTKYGRHAYEDLMQIVEMVIANPTSTAEELGARIGRKATWFNVMFREVCKAMGCY
jgi:hypothetical protein